MLSDVLLLRLPQRIHRLDELAHNLWWSWHPQARQVFQKLDYTLWKISGHNPVKLMREVTADNLQKAASAPEFLSLYDSVMAAFDADLSARGNWFDTQYPNRLAAPVAYFSSEFAIHYSLPIYAGGLGVLAGDICKESSDLGLPLVGVGLMYLQGYFQQYISADGWQQEIPQPVDFTEVPLNPVLSSQGSRVLTTVSLGDRSVAVGAWRMQVGRTTIYLLHTDIEGNQAEDRQLSDHLYVANQEIRIQQEVVLGIGGVRVLRALGIQPAIWHANEGHTSFMMLERIRELVAAGMPFAEARQRVRASTVFTTHTPVPASHDMFPVHLAERCFHNYWKSLGIDREAFLDLGRQDGSFNMTVLALNTAGRCNAVSRLNGCMSRKMWRVLWPEVEEDKVPIAHVTNGVHVPTWVSPEMAQLYGKYLGADWLARHDDPRVWERVNDIPDNELWAVRQALKRKLTRDISRRAQKAWGQCNAAPQQVLATGVLFDSEVLTIGFVRRFTDYKRPALMFRDMERLKRIVKNVSRPVQLVFAGKSHPNDLPAKGILQQTYSVSKDRDFMGRVAFIEDYDMHLAHYLVPGVDVWLNTPRRCREACGTSGIKASLNGVPHLSILDGWWHEGYNGTNGWAIGNGHEAANSADEDEADAEALYCLLEEKVVPLYYQRDEDDIPRDWLKVVKEAIRSITPAFSARRMMKDYAERMYGATLNALLLAPARELDKVD